MNEYFSTAFRLIHLAWHQGFVFFTKIRSLPPAILWILVLGLCFDVRYPPTNAMNGYMSIIPWLFFVMVWYGYLFLSGFELVNEHILILQINSRFLYAMSKLLFLAVLSLAVSLLGCVLPVIINSAFEIGGASYIPNGIQFTDFLGAFILSNIVGALGVSLAYVFQPSPAKHRDGFTLMMLFTFALLAVAKSQIFNIQAPFDYILFVFTPMLEIISLFNGKNLFLAEDLALAVTYGGIYCIIAVIVGYWLYYKKMYAPFIALCKMHRMNYNKAKQIDP